MRWTGMQMHQRARGLKASPSVRLFLVVFAAILLASVLVLAAVALLQYAASERTRYVEEGRKAAHDIAADLDRELGQAQAVVRTVR
jgi:F0F1-type ATP synthase membrane subunit b/b'